MNTRVLALARHHAALAAVLLAGLIASFLIGSALLAKAQVAPKVTLVAHNEGESVITASPINSIVHASVELESSTTSSTSTPTGTVDFRRFSNTSCEGGAVIEENVSLQNGEAESATTTIGTAGLSYRVHYDGDQNYGPADSDCRAIEATDLSPSLELALSSTTIQVGGSARALAELDGATDNASGTVKYTVYSNSSCTLNARDAGTKNVDDGEVPDSDSLVFNDTGDFYFRAVYSGDEHNTAATSSCADNRLLVVSTSTPPGDDDDDDDDDRPPFFKHFLPPGIFKKLFDDDFRVPPGIQKRFLDGDFFDKLWGKILSKWDDHDDDDDDEDEDDDDDDDDRRDLRGRTDRGKNKGND